MSLTPHTVVRTAYDGRASYNVATTAAAAGPSSQWWLNQTMRSMGKAGDLSTSNKLSQEIKHLTYLNEQLHSAMDQKDGQINALNTTISHLQRHIAILEGKIF